VSAWLMDAMLENSPTRQESRALYWALSLAAHAVVLATFLAAPLYWIDGLETHPSNYTQLVATSALRQNAAVTPAVKSVASGNLAAGGTLVAPKSVPNRAPALRELPADARPVPETPLDIAAAAGTGGQGIDSQGLPPTGGILANISRPYMPPPPQARPDSPLTVGGEVKPPRLISLVEPVYPPLLRRARVEGDVVINAVIDKQGNVVDAQAVSGDDLLVPAAMDALRRWKYEPTVLDGQVFSVLLRVTISFRLGKKG
jgi:TonB family protein